MKTFITVLPLALVLLTEISFGQNKQDKILFNDTSVISAQLSMNFKKILASKEKQGEIFPAMFACQIGD
ncbi:MAG: hypothetical protein JSU01_22795, partial [Bacteroidetes bacterium]|nr:hypothetical protein [Bacteroidota bacterium]